MCVCVCVCKWAVRHSCLFQYEEDIILYYLVDRSLIVFTIYTWLQSSYSYFFFLIIYSFWLGWVFMAARGPSLVVESRGVTLRFHVEASHWGDFSYCRTQALDMPASAVVECRLQSMDSVVLIHGLSCLMACGIFLDQWLNRYPLHWQADSYPLHHQESPATGFYVWREIWVKIYFFSCVVIQ